MQRQAFLPCKNDQFLMKLHKEFELIQSHLISRVPVPSLAECLAKLLQEEQRYVTQATLEQRSRTTSPHVAAYETNTRGRDLNKTQSNSCKSTTMLLFSTRRHYTITARSLDMSSPSVREGHKIATDPTMPLLREVHLPILLAPQPCVNYIITLYIFI